MVTGGHAAVHAPPPAGALAAQHANNLNNARALENGLLCIMLVSSFQSSSPEIAGTVDYVGKQQGKAGHTHTNFASYGAQLLLPEYMQASTCFCWLTHFLRHGISSPDVLQ